MTAHISFWEDSIGRARNVPLKPELEIVDAPLPFRVERLTYCSFGNIPVRAYLALPICGEAPARAFPTIVTAPGYGGQEFGVQLAECQRGYCILQVYPRGQGESASLWQVAPDAERAWLSHGAEQPEGFYYQGAYLDVLRGIDFLREHPSVDDNRIAMMGTSQGGAIALAAAALCPHVRAVVAHLPFMCALRTNRAFAGTAQQEASFLDTFDHFAPWQLAPAICAPTLLSSGGRDSVSPADTIRAVYERLSGEKALMNYPNLAHTSCGDFYQRSWAWLEDWL